MKQIKEPMFSFYKSRICFSPWNFLRDHVSCQSLSDGLKRHVNEPLMYQRQQECASQCSGVGVSAGGWGELFRHVGEAGRMKSWLPSLPMKPQGKRCREVMGDRKGCSLVPQGIDLQRSKRRRGRRSSCYT